LGLASPGVIPAPDQVRGEVYEAIKASKMTLVFVNTRSQAEMTFQALWAMNDDDATRQD